MLLVVPSILKRMLIFKLKLIKLNKTKIQCLSRICYISSVQQLHVTKGYHSGQSSSWPCSSKQSAPPLASGPFQLQSLHLEEGPLCSITTPLHLAHLLSVSPLCSTNTLFYYSTLSHCYYGLATKFIRVFP